MFPCLSIAEARTERALDVQDLRRPGARTRSGAPSSDPASYDEGTGFDAWIGALGGPGRRETRHNGQSALHDRRPGGESSPRAL